MRSFGQKCEKVRPGDNRCVARYTDFPKATLMDVRDAVASRFSCRAFLATPVPLATVRDILERAAQAPSGGNLQPWRVHVLTGTPLEDLKARIRPLAPANPRGEGTEYA